MTQQIKPTQSQKSTDPYQDSSRKESTHCHVHIEPGAKIDFVDDLRHKYETSQTDEKTYKDKQLFWTKIAAGLLLLTAGFTYWQGHSSQQSADAAARAADAAKGANDLAQLSNRAWLGPGRPFVNYSRLPKKGEKLPLVGDRFNVTVPFANTGKTPALFVRVYTSGVIVPINRGKNGEEYWDVGFPDIKESDYEQVGNIPPDANVAKGIFPQSSDINIWPTNLTKENVDALYAPTHRAVIFGKVLYCDVADPKVTHWFTFTMFLVLPGDPRFGLYPKPGYNDIGDYQQPCHGNQK